MKVAIDFDDTITLDEAMWTRIILIMLNKGHEVRVVTFRDLDYGNEDLWEFLEGFAGRVPVVFTAGNPKAPFCLEHEGWEPDVWIDDNPHWIGTVDKE